MSFDNEALEKAYERVFRSLERLESERDYWYKLCFWSIMLNCALAVALILEVF